MERKQTKQWTMRNGRKIRICDMDDNHLTNVIKLAVRRAEGLRIRQVTQMVSCPLPRGEMAADEFDRAFDDVLEETLWDYLPDVFENFMADYRRRGLEQKVIDEYIERVQAGGLCAELKVFVAKG